MPKIRFVNLPRPLWQHILERVAERAITLEDLQRLRAWVVSEPEAPDGDWYKDFGSFVLCGTGEYPKTVLKKGMKPFGTALQKTSLGKSAAIRTRTIEGQLKKLFDGRAWRNAFCFPFYSETTTPYGSVKFQGGVQTWINPGCSDLLERI